LLAVGADVLLPHGDRPVRLGAARGVLTRGGPR